LGHSRVNVRVLSTIGGEPHSTGRVDSRCGTGRAWRSKSGPRRTSGP